MIDPDCDALNGNTIQLISDFHSPHLCHTAYVVSAATGESYRKTPKAQFDDLSETEGAQSIEIARLNDYLADPWPM
jgi:hypothetical protein